MAHTAAVLTDQWTGISYTWRGGKTAKAECRESSLKTEGPEGTQRSFFSASCKELRAGVPGSGRAGGLRYLEVQCSPRMWGLRRLLKDPVTLSLRRWASSAWFLGAAQSSGPGSRCGGCIAFPLHCHWLESIPALSCLWAMDELFYESS